MSEFEITVASPYDREDLVVEIVYEHMLWVEISQETKDFIVQFYFYPGKNTWKLPYDTALVAIQKARDHLKTMTWREDPLWVCCLECKNSWETASREETIICPTCDHKFHNPYGPKPPNTLRMDHGFEIVSSRLSDLKTPVVQIYYSDIQWTQISNTRDGCIIEFYPNPKKEYWEFFCDEALDVLNRARRQLDE